MSVEKRKQGLKCDSEKYEYSRLNTILNTENNFQKIYYDYCIFIVFKFLICLSTLHIFYYLDASLFISYLSSFHMYIISNSTIFTPCSSINILLSITISSLLSSLAGTCYALIILIFWLSSTSHMDYYNNFQSTVL